MSLRDELYRDRGHAFGPMSIGGVLLLVAIASADTPWWWWVASLALLAFAFWAAWDESRETR